MNTLGIAAYIKRHWKPARKWDRSQLVPWVDWFLSDNRLGVIQHDGRVIGVGLARTLSTEDEHNNMYAHKEDGPIAWVDLVITQDPKVSQLLWRLMVKRFGAKQVLGFQRDMKCSSKPRFHNFKQMQRILCHGK